jgi:hypothetical protein
MDESRNPPADYREIGRFIYGTARLESSLAALLHSMGEPEADPAELRANVRKAEALFAPLPAASGDKIAFTALMHVLANFAELRDPMFETIADMPPDELATRNASLAAATEEVRRLTAVAQALSAD